MKLIDVISQITSGYTHESTVHRWLDTEWVPIPRVWREQDDRVHSYFIFDGIQASVYLIQTSRGGPGSTFLDGTGAVITRNAGLERIGVAAPMVELSVPNPESF